MKPVIMERDEFCNLIDKEILINAEHFSMTDDDIRQQIHELIYEIVGTVKELREDE